MNNLPQTNKSLGQHWLTDKVSLTAICDAAQLTSGDVVLEVGPGPGVLTSLLVQKAKQVIAVEFDAELARMLPFTVIAKNLDIIQQDILKFDLTTVPKGYKIVANIPYYLTSKLLRIISESSNPPQKVVLLVQKEVAERVAADSGAMSLLSVSAQYYWDVQLDIMVPKKFFVPPPKVDSQVIVMNRRSAPLFTGVDDKEFFKVVKAGFSARRKKLRSSLAGGLRMSKPEAEAMLGVAGIDSSLRPQELSLQQWYSMYKAYVNQKG